MTAKRGRRNGGIRARGRAAIAAAVAVLAISGSGGSASADPGCVPILGWARERITPDDAYLERWRDVDLRHPEQGPPWALGSFTVEGAPGGALGQGFLFHPDRLTLFALVREIYQISNQTPSADAGDEAAEAIVDASRAHGWTLGPGETIRHADALAVLDGEAMALCEERGQAPIPDLTALP